MHDDIKTVLLTKEEIDARVQEMGKQIAADYADKDLVVIVLLKGAAWFATDLTRAIDMPLRVDFMVASSYGNGTDMLRHYKPATLKTAALCDKAERRVNGLEADYVGFKIPDEFVVGYGLDYAGDYRNLPFIGILKPAVYARK